MTKDKRIRAALDLKKLRLPPSPPVISIEAEDYVDWTGDDALRIQVTLSEEADDKSLTGENVLDLKMAIHDSLLAHSVQLFPYIFLVKKSELLATSAEDRADAG